jgi:DeoR/GlpR family transcriptional regulator of sugar metabolism
MNFEAWNNTTVQSIRSEDINVQSISDFSAIPRETVRRKLRILAEKGWVLRDDSGYISATDKAKIDLAPLTTSSLTYLTKMKTVLAQS